CGIPSAPSGLSTCWTRRTCRNSSSSKSPARKPAGCARATRARWRYHPLQLPRPMQPTPRGSVRTRGTSESRREMVTRRESWVVFGTLAVICAEGHARGRPLGDCDGLVCNAFVFLVAGFFALVFLLALLG